MQKLSELKGVGEKTEKYLNKLGINIPSDLLYYFPRDYEYYSEPKNIVETVPNTIETIKVRIVSKAQMIYKNRLKLTYVNVSDGMRIIKAVWFNIPYITNYLTIDRVVILRGRISAKNNNISIIQPKIYDVDEYIKIEKKLKPIYTITKGINNDTIKKLVEQVIEDNKNENNDFLSIDIRQNRELAELNHSLYHIHFPNDINDMKVARKRLVYNEFFLFSLGILFFKEKNENKGIEEIKNYDKKIIKKIINNLPYTLTIGQNKAIDDIFNDFTNVKLMNRLIQGDVGSGKTIIAFLAMIAVATCNIQSAMMAPTEVLAIQHFSNLKKIIDDNELNINICLLTSSTKIKQRREILKNLSEGNIDIIIGTHSLISKDVVYKNLGLIITDEQHRFGVLQRQDFANKSIRTNTLIMSATPIPRTLYMLLYADMDISLIKDKPQNRLPIINGIIHTKNYYDSIKSEYNDKKKTYDFILKEINKGHQAYIICPSIDGNNDNNGSFNNFQNVVEYEKKIKKIFPKNIKIAKLHGKMKNDEKEKIMTDFKNKNIDILISTTVIEVGVDCENATIIMIEDAGRFGLATLHQLRGRVGRGDKQSYAIFVDSIGTEESIKRLNILIKSNDGFYIADEDLKLRGPGDVFGIKQSGSIDFKIANMYEDSDIFKMAAEDAKKILKDDNNLNKKNNETLKAILDEYVKNGYTI